MSENKSGNGDGLGCGASLITLFVAWVFLFGVTFGGKHYEIGCDSRNGVKIESRSP